MKIAIVTDSITNLRKEDLELYPNIHYGYLNVIVDGKSYIDLKEINNDDIFRFLDKGASCSTSQPAPDIFVNLYEDLLKDYDHIFSLHCSNNVSGTVNSARIASTMIEGAEEQITVVDTETAAIGVENIVIKVAELAKEGKSVEEITKVIDFYRQTGKLYLTIDDLSTLVRSGRLSKASAAIGNLLNIKPIVGFVDAQLEVVDKVRTKKRVLKWMVDQLATDVETSGKQIVRLTHINAIDIVNELKQMMETTYGDKVEVHIGNEIGPVMAIHFGRGGFGASWIAESYKIN